MFRKDKDFVRWGMRSATDAKAEAADMNIKSVTSNLIGEGKDMSLIIWIVYFS